MLEVIAGMSLVILALVFLPRYLKSGIATIPQFLEERYDLRSVPDRRIFIVAYMLILLPFVLFLGARGLNGMLNLQELVGFKDELTAIWGIIIFIAVLGGGYAI